VSVWVWGTVIHAWAFECEVLWSMRERLSVRYCDPCVSVWVWGTPALQNTQTFNLLNYWFVLVQFCLFGYDAMIYKIAKPQHHKSCDLCAFNCDYTASQKKNSCDGLKRLHSKIPFIIIIIIMRQLIRRRNMSIKSVQGRADIKTTLTTTTSR